MSVADKMTAIANAIRGKTGGTEALTLDGMAEAIAGIEAGGGSDLARSIVDRTITEYKNEKITTIGDYAFRGCKKLETVDVPAVTGLKISCFQGCTALKKIALPNLLTLNSGIDVFRSCTALTFADLGPCAHLGYNTFYDCTQLAVMVLRKTDNVCTLASSTLTNAATNGITVYVPQSLIEAYQSATQWSAMYAAGTAVFMPIEGSEYE